MLARTPAYYSSKNFSFFCFCRSLKVIERAMSKVQTIVCCTKYCKNDFRSWAKALWSSSVIIRLCLWFSSICLGEISQNFHNLWRLSCPTFKSLNKRVTKAVSSLFAILCFLRLSQIWSYEFVFCQQAPGRAQICLTVHQISGNSAGGNMINLARKIPIFCCHKTQRNEVELRQDLYLSMRKLSNLSPLAIFPTVFSFRLTSFSGVEGL